MVLVLESLVIGFALGLAAALLLHRMRVAPPLTCIGTLGVFCLALAGGEIVPGNSVPLYAAGGGAVLGAAFYALALALASSIDKAFEDADAKIAAAWRNRVAGEWARLDETGRMRREDSAKRLVHLILEKLRERG